VKGGPPQLPVTFGTLKTLRDAQRHLAERLSDSAENDDRAVPPASGVVLLGVGPGSSQLEAVVAGGGGDEVSWRGAAPEPFPEEGAGVDPPPGDNSEILGNANEGNPGQSAVSAITGIDTEYVQASAKKKKRSMSKRIFGKLMKSSNKSIKSQESKEDPVQEIDSVIVQKNSSADQSAMRLASPSQGGRTEDLSASFGLGGAESYPGAAVRTIVKSYRSQDPDPEQVSQPPPLPPMTVLFDNMTWFLDQLDSTCRHIEKSLLKSLSQKIADWALQPWSASKDKVLAGVTSEMRADLRRINANSCSGGGDEDNRSSGPWPEKQLLRRVRGVAHVFDGEFHTHFRSVVLADRYVRVAQEQVRQSERQPHDDQDHDLILEGLAEAVVRFGAHGRPGHEHPVVGLVVEGRERDEDEDEDGDEPEEDVPEKFHVESAAEGRVEALASRVLPLIRDVQRQHQHRRAGYHERQERHELRHVRLVLVVGVGVVHQQVDAHDEEDAEGHHYGEDEEPVDHGCGGFKIAPVRGGEGGGG